MIRPLAAFLDLPVFQISNKLVLNFTQGRLDINLRAYLADVLPKLGDWPINRVAELTPTAWKAAQLATTIILHW
jgi:hypothetical protein